MTEQFYIRVRGRVQGPFGGDKLRQLARRGQFSRLHEISVDGQNWEPAQERPELFATSAATGTAAGRATAAPADAVPELHVESSRSHTPREAPRNFASEAWYYVYGGKEQGPIDFAALYEMLASRRLAPETEVWRQGMAEWVPAHTVPGLVANVVSSAQGSAHGEGAGVEVGAGVMRVLVESRGWVIFIAIMAFLYGIVLLASGLLMIILGPRLAADTAIGLTQMVFAIVVAVGGWMLMNYAARVAQFHRRLDEESLASALATLRTFWTYVGIVLIILLTLGLLGVIMVLSMAGSLSEFMNRLPGR